VFDVVCRERRGLGSRGFHGVYAWLGSLFRTALPDPITPKVMAVQNGLVDTGTLEPQSES